MYKHLIIFLILILLSVFLFLHNSVLAQPRIAILYSELTEKNNNESSIKIIDVITTWELFLMQDKIQYAVIYDDDLESGIDDEFDILILPSVNFISTDQFKELQKFLRAGKSVICSGSKLEFQTNILHDYQNIETLFSLNSIEAISLENPNYLQSIIPNHLNHFSSDTESVLRISTKNQPLFCNAQINNLSSCGYIFSENNFNSLTSSIFYGIVGNGKFLWTGFDLNELIGGQKDLRVFKKLISDAIKWMDNRLNTYTANFCDSLSAPFIVTLKYNNALKPELIDVLQKNNIRPNLIVSPDQRVLKEILNKFTNEEIILELYLNDAQNYNDFKRLVDNFNRVNEISLSSILIEKENLDSVDLSMISNIGINKILYNEQVPGLPKFQSKDLLLIPFVKSETNQGSVNAINFLNYIPRNNCKDNLGDELLAKINQLKTKQHNFTSLALLKKWWNVRERITSEIKNISESEIEIWLTNKNSSAVNDLNVFLNLTETIEKKDLSISLNNSLLEYFFDDTSGVIVIKLVNILPNSVNKIKINFAHE